MLAYMEMMAVFEASSLNAHTFSDLTSTNPATFGCFVLNCRDGCKLRFSVVDLCTIHISFNKPWFDLSVEFNLTNPYGLNKGICLNGSICTVCFLRID